MKRVDRALALASRVRPRPAAALRVLPPKARLVAVGALVAAIVGGGLYLFWLRDSSLVAVKQVHVFGASGASAGRIEQRLRAAAGDMTTLDVDVDALAQSVATFPEVRAVRADPDFPHKLRIYVDERRPVAALAAGRSRVAVAADGTLLPQERSGRLPAVPVPALPAGDRLTNATALRAVAVLAAAKSRVRDRVQEVAKGKGGLRATLRGGGTVVLGAPVMLRDKWIAATKVLKDAQAAGAKYIDVRIPGRPVAGGLPADVNPAADSGAGSAANGTGDPSASGSLDPSTNPSLDPNAAPSTDSTTGASTSQNGADAGVSSGP